MQRIYLSLLSQYSKTEAEITTAPHIIFSENIVVNKNEGLIRTSPIFSINQDFNPSDFTDGRVKLIYTLDTYNIIRSIQGKNSDKTKIFLTHGIASIILLNTSENIAEGDRLFETINKYSKGIIGSETWVISDSKIIKSNIDLRSPQKIKPLDLNLNNIPIDDKFLMEELLTSFNYFNSCCSTYTPQYLDFANSLKNQIKELHDGLCKFSGAESNNSLPLLLVRDEILQTIATLKAVNTQAFNGINIVNSNVARSGRYSLFGIGMCYAGIYQLYEYCTVRFKKLIYKIKDLECFLSESRAPSLSEDDYDLWHKEIYSDENIVSIDNLHNKYPVGNNTVYHLMYFSHRYGYREAKKSISIAKQSIPLGIMPTWGLNTFFHEFLHAHVRVLLSAVGLTDGSSKLLLDDIANCERNINCHSAKSLKEFLQIAIFDCVRNSLCLENITQIEQNGFSSNILNNGFRLRYDKINEIIVHTLDFHYFYNSNADLYIKAIWMSWLMLPATENKIPEYILRTICAIGTTRSDSNLEYAFAWSLNKIKKILSDMKGRECTGNSEKQINTVIQYIDKIILKKYDHIAVYEYIGVWGRIAFIAYKFLFSKELLSEINDSSNDEPKDNSDEYTIPMNIGDFDSIEYENPIRVIQKCLELTLNKAPVDKDSSIVEGQSLYLYYLLAATSFNGSSV